MTLLWIVAASLAGGLVSAVAASLALAVRPSWIPALVSFAIGALLGAAFLEVIPHAFEHGDAHRAAAAILFGILGFFLLEKFLLWRHSHDEGGGHGHAHAHAHGHHGHDGGHDHGRSGLLIVVGDAVHNFLDGVLIAAAFLQSTQLGIVTAFAIVAHEIPQEVGDFVILLHSGYSRAKAFALNVLCSLATLVGGLIGYFALQQVGHWEQVLLGVVAASMIYVAVADLIPGLQKRPELRATAQQALLIAAGVGTVALVRVIVGDGH